jgi:nucleoside-diphosphate-sugar epimerase
MFNCIYVVGGAGYIGQRLMPLLEKFYPWAPVWCVDLQQPKRWDRHITADAREWEPEDPNSVIVYMASVQEPSDNMCAMLANEIMVDTPSYFLMTQRCKHMVYFSSIRAVEAREENATIYSEEKRNAEQVLLCLDALRGRTISILRPGTVFGGFSDALPVRRTTVPNKYLLTGELPDENYRAYICPMNTILWAATEAVDYKRMSARNVISNIGLGDPFTRHNLPSLQEWYGTDELTARQLEDCTDTNSIIEERCNDDE